MLINETPLYWDGYNDAIAGHESRAKFFLGVMLERYSAGYEAGLEAKGDGNE